MCVCFLFLCFFTKEGKGKTRSYGYYTGLYLVIPNKKKKRREKATFKQPDKVNIVLCR